ncbi:hypothetical protein LA10_05824 [Thermotoga neapolitana LA10]|uniref:Uncharacterized protein n=1 Tax=Thermotoga neapolitana (strain ATCC 49049 / DSM 4359 / NBRC 107923 / NS-E) TaxID=309803 RepID=B9K8K5_THENN|nr:Hypothetical Protein CTN_1112 [Thermotoga neapolitana DSM 4359]KFZ21627.1 hypothetical protein LA10_05824 [Thermotoga neapolitana LA10]
MKTLRLIVEFPVALLIVLYVGFDVWKRYLRRREK